MYFWLFLPVPGSYRFKAFGMEGQSIRTLVGGVSRQAPPALPPSVDLSGILALPSSWSSSRPQTCPQAVS